MTTAPPPASSVDRPAPVAAAVRGPFLVTLGCGLAAVLAAALSVGAPGAAGAAVGTVLVCGFFALGTLAVGLVAAVLPAASLLVALLTYSLQVLLMGAVLMGLRRSGALDGTLDAHWLAGTVIGGTLVWSAAQIHAHRHSRQPLYETDAEGTEASAR